jgi:hypothetical protein
MGPPFKVDNHAFYDSHIDPRVRDFIAAAMKAWRGD